MVRSEESGAAVYVDGLADHSGGHVGAEEEGGLGDLHSGLSAALEDGVEEAFKLFFGADSKFLGQGVAELFAHFCFGDGTRADGVDANALTGSFGGHHTSEAEEAGFCGSISGTPAKGGFCGEAGNIEDDTGFAGVHFGQNQFAEDKCGTKVYGEDLVEFFEGIVFDRNDRTVVASVVHENVDTTEFFACSVDEARTVRFMGKISGDIGGFSVCGSDFFCGGRQF